ncbi:TIGR01841 family phasin [Sphingomonas sanguinis]|uniref:TIGR01841 family phasin n=1 Tax=Sphingomonas sanguinis TaxID=33051 RepID=A0A7Y7QUJ0_9SPHN|nr:TIGR01841 family phasin [Sphingomonas sanguinis]NNG53866.1 TIGR01841 family phasin [Sphingomonas sanguinis]NVP30941.1 TIGR01841 family phasin [Sphingomonas sanguinis]
MPQPSRCRAHASPAKAHLRPSTKRPDATSDSVSFGFVALHNRLDFAPANRYCAAQQIGRALLDKNKPTVPAAKAVTKASRATKPVTPKTLPGLPSDTTASAKPPVAKPAIAAEAAPSNSPALPLNAPTAKVEAPKVETAPKPVVETPAAVAPVAPKVEAKPAPAPKAPVVKAEAKPVAAKPAPQPKAPLSAAAPTISSPTAAVSADSKPKDFIMDAQSTIENATAKTQAFFGDAQARTQATMEKSAKLFEDMIAFSKDNIEAVVESSKIAAKGAETLGQGAADYAKRSFETASQTLQTLSSVKSPTEFMKLQSDFARSAFDSMVTETSRSTEHMMKLAGEIAQPISNRFAVAAEKLKTVA